MPWSEYARADLLNRIRSLLASRSRLGSDKASRSNAKAELSGAIREYAQGLPVENASRCPICGAVLKMPIDPYGFDGPWWWSLCPAELPAPEGCKHFQLLLGGVDLHGRNPIEVRDSVRPGPGVPFVIGRILGMDGMTAVITSRQLPAGDTVYLIAYFSANPSTYPNLHQAWRSESMSVYNNQGQVVGWSIANDPWDFDLPKWAATGKLHWIAPGDASLALQKGSPSPYDNLRGTRDMQIAASGKVRVVPAPSGARLDPFE